MLKHPQLTLGRIKNIHQQLIKDRLIKARVPLRIEFCDQPHPDEASARTKGPWKRVEKGHRYGPAYTVFWFRVTGEIPKEWGDQEVGMIADVGGERTVWVDNVPERGIDGPHSVYRIADEAKGGAKLDLAIQVYSNNPSVRVHGYTPDREPLPETVNGVELILIHTALTELYYDVEFALSLLQTLREDSPEYATILRGLNGMCNALDGEDEESIRPARKAIRDALGSLGGDIKHTVVPVGHAHLDTAWLWPLHITHLKMAHTTVNQLYLMERYPDYVFVHSQASQYEWLEQEYPALFEKVKLAAAQGQWEPVGGMWVEADCNLTGSESLIRQFLYGRRYFEKHFGFTTDDMWLPDVFGYAAALPQILNKFGIRYFLTQKISWNQFNKFPHNTFWWQGIDGSRIWSHFPPADTYIGDCTPNQIVQSVRQHKDQARSDQSLYVFGWGDGGGGPTEQHLELLKRGTIAPCMPSIDFGRRAVEFFQEARQKSRDLATWAGELYLEMHRGTYTSQAANKKANRECEFLLRDAEWLACFQEDFKSAYPSAELEKAWKLVLLNQFHDIIPGSSITEVYEDSARDYAVVREIGERVIQACLTSIGNKLATRGMNRPAALFANAETVTQASVPWMLEDTPASLCVGDSAYPVQLVEEFGERKLILETPEEALGAVAVGDFSERPAGPRIRLKARDRRLENDQWSVRFDSNGNIVSIASLDDKLTEFIQPGKMANCFQLFDDRPNFWNAWDIDVFAYETEKPLLKSESFEIVERGPVRVAAEVVKKFGNSTIRQRISLGPTPGIRFDTEVDWHEDHKLLKVAFPLNVNAARATYEIQFGHVERPTHYNTSWDMARFEVPAQKWVDVSQGDLGVALLNDGKYGHDCRGNVLRLSLLKSPKAPDPMCDMGRHRFTYVLLPHFGSLQSSDVIAAAYSLNSPLRHAFLGSQDGVISHALPRFLSVDTRNLIIESVKKAEDSDRIIVRLYECHNTRGRAWFRSVLPISRAWVTDLNEEIMEEFEVTDGMFAVDYAPFEIITLMLEV